ncbi:putative threonine-rich GPI-anchored glyco isoform X2 [Labeo rohita]|uniref:Putative threonine-rich GPI-anchored glyco isoform X2 n=1 Tax=Labeo rohita TaxID=84645 RepID=A0A498LSN3_LABRO|nr:putative threonine-rich GPI-anchored glyco isoform X2 [Labeo rohita]
MTSTRRRYFLWGEAVDISPVVRDIMMNQGFAVISPHLEDFGSQEWVSWFTGKLTPLLPSLTPEMLQTVTSKADCDAYHVIVGALSSVFEQLTSQRQRELAPVLLAYLKQSQASGSTCGSNSSSLSTGLWQCFGRFSIYVDYEDLRGLFEGFGSFEALDLLSASQLAQLTLSSGALNNADLIGLVFDRLDGDNAFQDVDGFLAALTRTPQALDINPVVRDIMMNRVFAVISPLCLGAKRGVLVHSPPAQPDARNAPDSNVERGLRRIPRHRRGPEQRLRAADLAETAAAHPSLVGLPEAEPVIGGSLSTCLWACFGKFSIYVDYEDLRGLIEGFGSFEALDLMSASQVAQLTLNSGALNNADLIGLVFDRLDAGNAFRDVDEFLAALTRTPQAVDISPVVRDIMMNQVFAVISPHLEDFGSQEWVSWFPVKLTPLLPSLTPEMLQTVTSKADCDAYHVIVGALSSVFEQLTSQRQRELAPVLLAYLKQSKASGSTCGSNSSSLSTCLWQCFGRFSIYVDYEDLRGLFEGFGSFEALDLLSASQLAQLTLSSGALNNADLIGLVFDRLDGDNAFQDVDGFLAALTRTPQALDINPVVRDIMMNRVFAVISPHLEGFGSQEWVSWFTVKLIPLLPSLTPEMLQTVTSNADCDAYHVIVGALSSVFEQLTSLRQRQLTPVLLAYLKQSQASGSTCGSNSGSLSTCLWACFGKFSIYVDYEDLRGLIEGFGSFEALDLMSASQVAQLTLNSGALNNADLIGLVFDRLDAGNAFRDVDEFLAALTRTPQAVDISPVVRDIMMNQVFAVISPHLEDFGSQEWVSWFTVKLTPLLPSLTPEMLQTVTSKADCDAYHVIVGALSSVFEQLTSQRQRELAPVLLAYLKQSKASGSTCGSNSSSLSTCLWQCFGRFSIYVDYEDLRGLFEGFGSFEALDLLSASQLAQLTLSSGALNNADLIGLVFDRLDGDNAFQDVDGFLAALTRTPQALDINPVVRDIMMNRVFAVISPHLEGFGSQEWVSWFTVKLIPLLPSLTPEMLQTVTSNADCDAYHVIVGALSSVFEQLTSLRQRQLTPVLLAYLKQSQASGSTCGSNSGSLSTCLWACFGKFSIYVDYEDLRGLIEGFGSFEALDLMSASQVAQLTLNSGALNNADLIGLVFDRLDAGNAFRDVDEFLAALTRTPQAVDISPVVRDIMMNQVFAVISPHLEDFGSQEWVSWFTVKLTPLLPSLTPEMLQTVTSKADCDAYHVIVGALSSVFEQLTSQRQRELAPVLLAYLKQSKASGSTCGSNSSSLSTCLWQCFGRFSIYVDYEDLRGLFEGFGSFEALDLLSASQLAQLTLSSGALNNADLIGLVFDRLDGDNAFQDVDGFLAALTRTPQALDINPVVRDIMMNRVFAVISPHLEGFGSQEWVSWFTVKLIPLLPSLTPEMLQTVTSNADCDAYHVIVGALSSVFEQLTSLRQRQLTPVLLAYLKQSQASGSTCGSNSGSLSTCLWACFGKFSIYVDYEDLRGLIEGFGSFEALDLMSASQVAQLTLNSGALNNADLIGLVFDRLDAGNAFRDVDEFLAALTRTPQAVDISPVVRDIMMNQVFAVISPHLEDFGSQEWVSWFTVKLTPILPSLTPEMLQTVTSKADCDAYHVIVGALSSVFEQLTSQRQRELAPVLLAYLKQSQASGSTCGSNSSSLSTGLWQCFGRFSIYVDYEDLRGLFEGFGSFEALDLLSASQLAQLTLSSGALNNADLIGLVFDRLDGDNAFQDVDGFLAALTRTPQALDINPVVRDVMMNRVFAVISPHLEGFGSQEWVSWFTVKLIPLLPSLTPEMLQTVTSNADCDAYHVIVGALSSVFEQLTSLRQRQLTPVLLAYLKQSQASGSTCGSNSGSLSTWLWACFGKFSIYVHYEDLRGLIEGFGSARPVAPTAAASARVFGNALADSPSTWITKTCAGSSKALAALRQLDLLSASQLAQLTLSSGALNNADLIGLVFDRLDGDNAFQDVDGFLAALTRTPQALDINPVVRDIMMNRVFAVISPHLEGFGSQEWVSWFTVKLIPLLPSLTPEMLQTVTSNADCDAYHVIVGALSSVFEQLTSQRQRELAPVLLAYLKQSKASGSTCGSNSSSLSTCLWQCFGRFSIYVDYEDLRGLFEGFGSFEALDLLSASQLAQLTLSSGALNNADLIGLVFDRLDGDNAYPGRRRILGSSHPDTAGMLSSLRWQARTGALDINPVVRDIMMNRVFAVISPHLEGFGSQEWVSWFTVKLIPLLPSLTPEMLQTVTSNADCDAYHVIVGALSSVFEQLTSLRQRQLTPVLLAYLKQSQASGSTCGSNSGSLSTCLWACFGKFSIYVDYEDLRGLIEGFGSFEALDLMSASQVAQLTLNSGALNNADLIGLVFDRLDAGNAFRDVDEFLAALTRTPQAVDISPVVRDIMMNQVFAVISPHLEDFGSQEWVSWFTVKLTPLLPSLTPEMLQTVTSKADCDAYHVIVGALSSVFEQLTSQRQRELAPVLLAYLKQSKASGSTCGSNSSSLSTCLWQCFGRFSIYVDYEDLRGLFEGFGSFEALDLLSASQLAQLTLSSGALNNADLIGLVFDRLDGDNAFQDVDGFLAALTRTPQALDINPVVRDIMMNRVFAVISPHLEGFGSQEWVSWFTVKLIPLLPSLTPEMLQTVTSNADCDAYHVIVGALSSVFEQLTSLRQRQLTPVLLAYLKQSQASGSTCGSNSGSLSTCLWACFGKFSIYVDYEDLRGLIEGFGSFEALDLMSASQVAQLTLNSGALNNADLIGLVFDRLDAGNAFRDVDEFLAALTRTPQSVDISPVVRDIMMNQVFAVISPHLEDFGSQEFSLYVDYEDLRGLFEGFGSFEALDLLSASQLAQLTLSSGALNNADLIGLVFDRLDGDNAFQDVDGFLAALTRTPQALDINPVVRDIMMNRVFAVISPHLEGFGSQEWVSWFHRQTIPLPDPSPDVQKAPTVTSNAD